MLVYLMLMIFALSCPTFILSKKHTSPSRPRKTPPIVPKSRRSSWLRNDWWPPRTSSNYGRIRGPRRKPLLSPTRSYLTILIFCKTVCAVVAPKIRRQSCSVLFCVLNGCMCTQSLLMYSVGAHNYSNVESKFYSEAEHWHSLH